MTTITRILLWLTLALSSSWGTILYRGQTMFYGYYTNGGDCYEYCVGRIEFIYPQGIPGLAPAATSHLRLSYEVRGDGVGRLLGYINLNPGDTFPEIQEVPWLRYIYDGAVQVLSTMGNKVRIWRTFVPIAGGI